MRTFTLDTGCAVDRWAEARLVQTPAELIELDQWLAARSTAPLGLDTEWNAVDHFDPSYRLRLIQIADPWVSWLLPVEHLPTDAVGELIQRHHYWVAHFAENESRSIARGLGERYVRFNETTPHIADLQVVQAYHNPRTVVSQSSEGIDPRIAQEKGLKETATRELTPVLENIEKEMHAHFRELAPKGHKTPKKSVAWGFANISIDDELFLRYSAMDPLITIRLWHAWVAVIRARGQWPIVRDDLARQWQIDGMTYRGLLVDEPYAKWLDEELAAVVADNATLLEQHGVPPTAMGPKVGAAFEALGAHTDKLTGSGKPSWDKNVIKELASDADPVIADLATAIKLVRQASKFRSTYVQPMLDSLSRDGRVHCSMRVIGTTTGRNSAARPPLQQLPKQDTRVRAAYRAPDGWVIVSSDFEQGEPRVMAGLSGDLNYRAAILAGDINSVVAAEAFGSAFIEADGKTAGTASFLMRQGAKAGFLARCYGAQIKRLADTLNVPESRAVEINQAWTDAYPDLWSYASRLNRREQLVLESGRVCPLWDRFYVAESGELVCGQRPSRLALNYATQGTQRDLLMYAVDRLVSWGWSWALMFLVHDEILLCVPEFMAHAARDALQAAMTMDFHGVPITCKAEIEGRTWLSQPESFALAELAAVEGG